MSVYKAGFFLEHAFNECDEPIAMHVNKLEVDLRSSVADYLLKGRPIIAASGRMFSDLVTGAEGVATRCLRTDGEWVWPNDYAHNVRVHGVAVPTALLTRALRGGSPVVDESQVRWVLEQLRGDIRTTYQ